MIWSEIQLKTPRKSRAMTSTKNKKKNNNKRRVNRRNCQTRRTARNATRTIAQRGIDNERNSIPPVKRNTVADLNIWNCDNGFLVETIKKSCDMRMSDHNDDTLSHTKCCNMLRNGRAEWSSEFLFPQTYKNSDSMSHLCISNMILLNNRLLNNGNTR